MITETNKENAKSKKEIPAIFVASSSKTIGAALRALASCIETIKIPVFPIEAFKTLPENIRESAMDGARKAFNAENGEGAQQIKGALEDGLRQIVAQFGLGGRASGAGRKPQTRWEELSVKQCEMARRLASEGKDSMEIASTIAIGEQIINCPSIAKALKIA